MKTKVTTILIMLCLVIPATAQKLSFNKVEYFTTSVSIDPGASFKENGINAIAEIEYVGLIYAKAGFESFDVLPGGYFDIHGAIGINLTHGIRNQHRYYIGGRAARVYRNNDAETNPGIEAGIDYAFKNGLFIGIRGTYDKRYDMQLLNWPVIHRESFYVRIGYRWSWKNKGFEN